MDLNDFKLFKALSARMHWLQARQRVLAENVANADTPRYKAMDLKPISFKTALSESTSGGIALRQTHGGHFGASGSRPANMIKPEMQDYRGNATGNNVVLEEEMMKSAETAADYRLATTIYKKSVGLFRLAIAKT